MISKKRFVMFLVVIWSISGIVEYVSCMLNVRPVIRTSSLEIVQLKHEIGICVQDCGNGMLHTYPHIVNFSCFVSVCLVNAQAVRIPPLYCLCL